jgi:flavodoxin
MLKAIIVYESRYGNTKLVAERIAEGMNQVSGGGAVLVEVKEVALSQIIGYDLILVGSPNHGGQATSSIRKFIDKLGKLNLQGKRAAVFDTYQGRDLEKAIKKMERQVGEKAPGMKLVAPGLSIMVKGMKGPIADGDLPKCQAFGAKIATMMKG